MWMAGPGQLAFQHSTVKILSNAGKITKIIQRKAILHRPAKELAMVITYNDRQ
jgi:hypothetical protein